MAGAAITATSGAQAREDREAVVRLEQMLLSAATATSVLQDWCDMRHGAGAVKVHARVDRSASVPATAAQRARLGVSADEPLAYRSVALMGGDVVLSRAENWYVPARLTAAMREALAGDAPFGAVIRPLIPAREALGSEFGWDGQGADDVLRHRALVRAGGLPIAEVVETYQRAMLPL